jgi:hypothetical protein
MVMLIRFPNLKFDLNLRVESLDFLGNKIFARFERQSVVRRLDANACRLIFVAQILVSTDRRRDDSEGFTCWHKHFVVILQFQLSQIRQQMVLVGHV